MAFRKIQQRILVSLFGLVVLTTLPASLWMDRWVSRDLRELAIESLEREGLVLAHDLEHAGAPLPLDADGWVREHKASANARLTIIFPDGTVMADSDVPLAEVANLDNHAARREVAAALRGEIGSEVRHSSTISQNLLYVALPVGRPIKMILRLALPIDQVERAASRARSVVWLTGLGALTLALFLSGLLSRWLSRPILAMTQAARAMSRGDFSVRLPDPPDDELGDLALALDTLRSELAARIEELRNEGFKLQAIVSNLPEGVALVQAGSIVIANPAFSKLLNLSGTVEQHTLVELVRFPEISELLDSAVLRQTDSKCEVSFSGRSLSLEAHPLGRPMGQQVLLMVIDMTGERRLEKIRRDFVANASHE